MNFFKSLFGSKKKNAEFTPELIEKIIQDYGAVLEKQAPRPGCVADEERLPYLKKDIKKALMLGMKVATNNDTIELLKFGYLEIANWQNNVGLNNQGLDMTKIDLNGDPMAAINKFQELREEQGKWTEIVAAEKETLEKELEMVGL